MSVFIPSLYLKHVTEITPELLQQQGIRGLILDVDNTLALHNSQEIIASIEEWLQLMRAHGIKLVILSNNIERRVAPFAKRLGLLHVAEGCKPMSLGFRKAVRRLQLPKETIAVVGDQVYTDILGGNLNGMYTILTAPLAVEQNIFVRAKRRAERVHINRYYRLRGEE